MYLVGVVNDTVYQYTLSTPWDVSTATYASKSKSVSAQETYPVGVTFKTDGTKMYVIGITGGRVWQYSLSSAWDVSTASYDSVSKSVSSQTGEPYKVELSSAGTKMYVLGNTTGDSVYQYTLSTAWDISTATYDSDSKSVAAQESQPYGMAFKTDGSKMYIVGIGNDTVYQYSRSVEAGAYKSVGTTTSTNLLSSEGGTVSSIDSLDYTLSALPSGTWASVQFSQDNSTWKSAAGTTNASTTLSVGSNSVSLSTLAWTGSNFYYRVIFSGGSDTPVLDSITLNYTTSGSSLLRLTSLSSGGKLGLGTSTPYSKLTVWGPSSGNIFEAVTSASTTALHIDSSGSTYLPSGIWKSTGQVGIGTTTPFFSLTIASSTGPQFALGDGTNNSWTFRNAGGSFFLATSTYSATSTVAAAAISASTGAFTFGSPATTTFTGGIESPYLNITGTAATSTFARGIDLAGD